MSHAPTSVHDSADRLTREFGRERFDARSVIPVQPSTASLPLDFARELQVMLLTSAGTEPALGMVDITDQDTLARAEQITGLTLQPALMTSREFARMFREQYRDEHLRLSTSDLATRFPDDSASRVLTSEQRRFLIGAVALLVAAIALWPFGVLIAVVGAVNLVYLGVSIHKLYLIHKAYVHNAATDIADEQIAALADADLPIFTLLIPLYRESSVLPTLVEAISRLDYPKAKLDVKLLLEEEDTETIRVAEASDLPPYMEIVVVPQGKPKGKPRACNYGLSLARGRYTVIYDAEDVPEPDQLKKVVLSFQQGGDKLGCVQCKLNYYNQGQNLLTRWFTTEYSMWFDLFLPALIASGAPIPLGGTSNHFPTRVLRDLGAWDPYNVTEDADLGIRLYKRGYTTTVIDSTTWEEANSDTRNWILQRSRWIKGYVQTWLVHMRRPVALYRSLGLKAWLSLQASIGGTFFVLLMNPLFWGLTLVWYVTRNPDISTLFPTPIFFLGSVSLFIGNFMYIFGAIMGCLNRGYYSLVKYCLLLPIYWVLMSLAAWKGFVQLFYKASYWEKTVHGLYRGPVFETEAAANTRRSHERPAPTQQGSWSAPGRKLRPELRVAAQGDTARG